MDGARGRLKTQEKMMRISTLEGARDEALVGNTNLYPEHYLSAVLTDYTRAIAARHQAWLAIYIDVWLELRCPITCYIYYGRVLNYYFDILGFFMRVQGNDRRIQIRTQAAYLATAPLPIHALLSLPSVRLPCRERLRKLHFSRQEISAIILCIGKGDIWENETSLGL